MSKATKYLSG